MTAHQQSLRILLIEDDLDHADLIRRHLRRTDEAAGIELVHIADLQFGLERIEEGSFDAVLCDLRLPGSEPASTLAAVLTAARETPIVVLSSLEHMEFAARAVKLGAQDFLVKSQLSGALLVRVIRYSIERKRTEMRLKALNESLEREVERRTQYVWLLQDVAMIANEAADVRVAFQQALNRICTQMEWEIGQALMLKERGAAQCINLGVSYFQNQKSLRGLGEPLLTSDLATRHKLVKRMLISGRPEFTRNLASDDDLRVIRRFTRVNIRSAFAFPVFVRNRTVAMFEFFLTDNRRPDDALFEVMARIGTQMGRVVERRELEHALEELTVEEQRRINSELHDGIGHELSGLAFYANSFLLKLQDEKSPHVSDAQEILTGIRSAMKELRAVLKGLAAADIAEDGLPAALSELAAQVEKRVGLACVVQTSRGIELPNRTIATQLYRIAQEAVNNAVKHAKASQIDISLDVDARLIVLSIRDNGIGIELKNDSVDGLGLGIMKHRTSLIGGEVQIGRGNGGGTLVCCRISLDDDNSGMQSAF
ncbi:response regulator [bacterium]|nr:response regulator [bacterium]